MGSVSPCTLNTAHREVKTHLEQEHSYLKHLVKVNFQPLVAKMSITKMYKKNVQKNIQQPAKTYFSPVLIDKIEKLVEENGSEYCHLWKTPKRLKGSKNYSLSFE